MAMWHQNGVDRADDSPITACADRLDRTMKRNKGAGAGGFDRFTWPAKVQKVAEPVRSQ